MKRTIKKKPEEFTAVDVILTADWHLREDVPICRVDDFIAAQWDKVRQVRELQEKYDCMVFHAGDLFHHWKTSPALLSRCLEELPRNFHTVYGNHDLPQHSMEMAWKSGVHTLHTAGALNLLKIGHWNDIPEKIGVMIGGRRIYVWHVFTYTAKAPFPGAEEKDEGHTLLKKYPAFDLIVTGDNHQSFVCKDSEGRLLVNPGSLTRQTADQTHHEPCVYLYNAESNSVKAHYLKVNENAVSRSHLKEGKERDERISAFIERLETDWESTLDFEENLKRFTMENNVDEDIMKIIHKSLES